MEIEEMKPRYAADREDDQHDNSTTYSKHALATTITVNLAACLERLDEQVVPALYDALGDAFDATPVQLSMLTLSRALIQALASPMGGVLGQHCNRAHVLAAGCMLWGCMTCLFGMLRSLHVGYLVWGINGIGLALVIPTTQSLVADYSSREKRGRAFGMLACTAAVGAMLGSVYATNVGGWSHGAIQGWRLVLVSVGLLSVAVGVVGLVVVRDPGYSLHGIRHTPVARFTLVGFGRQLGAVLSIPTFSLIVLQGIVGTSAWSALTFLTLYFQLLGMSDAAASALVALLLGGSAVGSVLGGMVGDWAARWSPNHGRILVCQASVFSGIPSFILLLKVLPRNGQPFTVTLYALVLGATSLVKTWAAPACNNPIFAEIVPVQHRNLVYAFDRCLEGALAALVAPVVGWTAQHMFGFDGTGSRTGEVETDLHKAHALGNAMLVFTVGPWALCLLLYTGLHWTYPADRVKEHHGDRDSGDEDEAEGLLQ